MRWLIIGALLLHASTAGAVTYYADAAAGSDANDGLSPGSPWQTINKINHALLAPGDAVLLKCGARWRERLEPPAAGTPEAPIVFGSYGAGASPLISGADPVTVWSQAGPLAWQAVCPVQPYVVAFDGKAGAVQSTVKDLGAPGDWTWAGGVLTIYAAAAPATLYTGSGVEAGARDYCILAETKSNVRYMNLRLAMGNVACFRATGGDSGVRLADVEADDAGNNAAFIFDASAGPTLLRCSALRCRGENNGDGFSFGGACRAVTLTDCVAAYNRRRGAQFDTGIGGSVKIIGGEFHHQNGANQADGIAIDANDEILIEGVWSHDNGVNNDSADGIQISGGSRNPVVRYCRVENNYNGGIILEVNGGTIAYNVSSGNRHGIAVGENPDRPLAIFNNTVYNNEYGIFFYQTTPTGPVNVNNNIIYGADSARRAAYLEPGLDDSKITMKNNCFWGDQDKYMIEWNGALYQRSDFAAFIQATGKGGASICADPAFANPAGGKFDLLAGSPCLGQGVALGQYRDYAGTPVPLGGAPDLGAYQRPSSAAAGDPTPPAVSAIVRADRNPTADDLARFYVIFSKGVTGVTSGSFGLAASGLTGAAIESVAGAGSFYTVTVATGAGEGSLRLDLTRGDTIRDLNSVALGGGAATAGQSYTIDRTPPVTKGTSVSAKPLSPKRLLLLTFSGLDSASGLDCVRLFYKKKDDPNYQRYGLEFSSSPITIDPALLGTPGEYYFFTVGLDNAGNIEAPHETPDLIYTLAPSAIREWALYQ